MVNQKYQNYVRSVQWIGNVIWLRQLFRSTDRFKTDSVCLPLHVRNMFWVSIWYNLHYLLLLLFLSFFKYRNEGLYYSGSFIIQKLFYFRFWRKVFMTSERWNSSFTECPKFYRKSVLHLLTYIFEAYRCSTDLR